MLSKSPKEAVVIIDSIATSDYQSHHDRAPVQRKGIVELDTQNAIVAQNKLLTVEASFMMMNQVDSSSFDDDKKPKE